MSERPTFRLQPGLPEAARGDAARLFWRAFADKLGRVMGPEATALRFLERVMDGGHAISAVDPAGRLLGIAGFKTADGAFVDGGLRDLAACYGWLGTAWRAPLLQLLERDVEPGSLLMDGIFVNENARGQGVGSALLDAIREVAQARGLESVRLDVIDTNPRARALYERKGFAPTASTDIGPLRHLFGFSQSTTMVLKL